MLTLGLSVFSSTIIFVIFKSFNRFKIDTFQVIVANYFTAFACGFLLYSHEWNSNNLVDTTWVKWAALCSLLFISLFWITARSSQKNGVAVTSVSVKMSMAFSLLLMIGIYNESITIWKIFGVVLAIFGILLISIQKESNRNAAVWMLFILFIGSGVLDFSINYIQKHVLTTLTPSLFSAIGFGASGCIGLLILLVLRIGGKLKISVKSLFVGIILGIPNFFSIYLLMSSYRDTGWEDSTVLAVTNVAVVLFSSALGLLIFKEKLTKRKILGLVCAILAISILAIFNQ